MYRTCHTFRFEAAHELSHLPPSDPCHYLHGHSYRVALAVESEELTVFGTVALPGSLDALGVYLSREMNGRNLSSILRDDATAENLAAHLFHVAKGLGFDPASVVVFQGDDVSAEYRP